MITSGSSRGGLLEIGISLVMQDRFSNTAREASSEMRRLHQEAKMAVEANLQAARQISNSLSSFSDRTFDLFGTFLRDGVEYIDTMVSVEAITESSGAQFEALGKRAKQLGVDTMFSAKEVASGMKYLAMAGMKAKEIEEVIGGATYLAGATGMRIEGKGGAADLMTNVAKAFRIEGTKGANMVADQLTEAALSANVSVSDLAESIKYAAASMVSFKRPLPEVLAMLGTLGNAGIQGSMAGVALQNMVLYLGKAITQTNSNGHKWLQQLGLTRDQLVDANGDILPLVQVLEKFKKALDAAGGSVDQSGILREVFSVRGMRGAQALLGDLEGFRKLYDEIYYNSQGKSEAIMDKRMNSLAGKLDQLKEALVTFGITWSETLAPVLTNIFHTATQVVTWIQERMGQGFGKFITYTGFVIPIVTKIISVITSGVIAIRQAHNDTLVTGSSMLKTLFTGWMSMKTPALQYLNILKEIQMLQTGVGTGMMGISSASAKKKAMVAAGVAGTVYRDGRYTGRMMSNGKMMIWEKVPGRRAPLPLGYNTNSIKNNQIATNLIAHSVLGNFAGSAVKKGLFSSIGLGLKSAVGGLVSVLGGPWGIAIIAISTLLPTLIRSINNRINGEKENTDSNEENTHSVYTLAGKIDEETRRKNQMDLTLTQEQIALINSMKYWNQRLRENDSNATKPAATIVINIDGKKAMEQLLEDKNNQVNINLGTQTS